MLAWILPTTLAPSFSGRRSRSLSDDPMKLLSDLQALAAVRRPQWRANLTRWIQGGRCLPRHPFAKFASTKILFPRNMTNWAYGRIEVFTKPGTDQFQRASLLAGTHGGNSNHRNPFEASRGTQPPGYHSTQYQRQRRRALRQQESLVLFNIEQRISTKCPSSVPRSLIPLPCIVRSAKASHPRTRTNLSPRSTIRLAPQHAHARYQYERENRTNDGIGSSVSLPWASINRTGNTSSDQRYTIINGKIINETASNLCANSDRTPQSTAPTISAQGAFTEAGTAEELARYPRPLRAAKLHFDVAWKHFLKFGARLRATRDSNESRSGFNGNFNFGLREIPLPRRTAPRRPARKFTGISIK